MKMKGVLLTIGSFVLTAGVISNAYIKKRQFYPSVVFITKSSPSMAVLYVQAFVFVVLMWNLIQKVFFGQLRAAEMEHLIERSWYAITETCLAFTVFRDDFSPRFVALFTLLLFIKCFHWLGEDRVDYMERSPVISLIFHARVLSLLTVLSLLDAYFINHAYYSTLIKGASVQLVFGFEYAILLTMVLHILVKYILHSIDLQSENPWDNKAVYLLYTELVLGFIKVVLYMLFLFIMIKVHTFPLFAIRPIYLTMRTFKKAFNDVIMSRRAIRNMNTLYPNATEEELSSGDNVCIICREEMIVGSCKKLPCNHIFHSTCLRSWFQRQQTCPTCRMDVLRTPAANTTPQQRQQPQQQQQQPAAQPPPPPPVFPGFPMPTPPAAPGQTNTSVSGNGDTSSATPPFMMPPMFMPMPFMPPMPNVPSDLKNLSKEELEAMEGTERQNVEARIQWLRNIHMLLDAAIIQLNQYANLASSQQRFRPGQASTTTVTATTTVPTPTEVKTTEKSEEKQDKPEDTKKTDESTPIKPLSTESDNKSNKEKDQEGVEENLEGAVGGEDPLEDGKEPQEETEELREIRRRRLEKFTAENKPDLGLD